ncbi:DUF2274 domain-containing protein [Rhizobium leguminosarum]|uniref:DUF2274 domain-containing protein n=1 Tax=Rhizobium leguminosarum TaxID=384 RepID=UPI001441BCFF|nr:DUF2274 domain-containing protein [Rhizobium leguminosarum]NKL53440.1 DUF2274 domain-containing protein [Rhizobium leguminosarum bv. viciae]
MVTLKLGPVAEDKPAKITVELPTELPSDLAAYVDYLNSQYVHVSWTRGVSCRN